MKSKTLIPAIAIVAVVAAIIIAVVASPVYQPGTATTVPQGQPSTVPGSATTSVQQPAIQQSNGTNYTKLYAGQPESFGQFGITLAGTGSINGSAEAVFNISSYGNFSAMLGSRQYTTLNGNGAPYLVVDQIGSTGGKAWATVSVMQSAPSGFSYTKGYVSSSWSSSSNATGTAAFTRVYEGSSSAFPSNYRIEVLNISSRYNVRLNVTAGSAYGSIWMSPHMYYSLSGSGGPYVLVGNISYDHNDPSQSWANISVSMGSYGFNHTNGTYINLAPPGRAYGWAVDLSLPWCGTTDALLSTTPIAPSEFVNIDPLGWLNEAGGHVVPSDHIGFGMTSLSSQVPPIVNVVSPGNVTIFSVDSRSYNNGNHDYTIYFSPCANVTFWLGHVHEITNQKLLNSLTSANASGCSSASESSSLSTSDCTYNVSVRMSANEVIGQFGGTSYVLGLDMGAYDSRLPPAQYADSYYLYNYYNGNYLGNVSKMQYVACPLSYLPQALQDSLSKRMGNLDVYWTGQPPCGYPVDQDMAGAAQGIWSAKRASNYTTESGLIALVHDNLVQGEEVFSIGDATGMSGVQPGGVGYYFNYETSGYVNRAFANVTADGHVYCYDSMGTSYGTASSHPQGSVSARMLLEVMNATVLRMQYQAGQACGSGPWSFTQGYSDFYR